MCVMCMYVCDVYVCVCDVYVCVCDVYVCVRMYECVMYDTHIYTHHTHTHIYISHTHTCIHAKEFIANLAVTEWSRSPGRARMPVH